MNATAMQIQTSGVKGSTKRRARESSPGLEEKPKLLPRSNFNFSLLPFVHEGVRLQVEGQRKVDKHLPVPTDGERSGAYNGQIKTRGKTFQRHVIKKRGRKF